MNFIHQVIIAIFGNDVTGASIVASFILVFLGAAINFTIELGNRDKASGRTPEQFSLKFLIQDNARRLLLSFLFCIVAVICGPELFSMLEVNWKIPSQYSQWTAILLGWGSDYLPMRIKQKFFKQE